MVVNYTFSGYCISLWFKLKTRAGGDCQVRTEVDGDALQQTNRKMGFVQTCFPGALYESTIMKSPGGLTMCSRFAKHDSI